MQQTQKYKLNLIETSDTFSPAPLNENTQMLETALSNGLEAETTARMAADAALSSRVTALEARKILYGTFTGGVTAQTISLGATPLALFVHTGYINGQDCLVLSTECGGSGTNVDKSIEIVPNGFHITIDIVPNHIKTPFSYVAIA